MTDRRPVPTEGFVFRRWTDFSLATPRHIPRPAPSACQCITTQTTGEPPGPPVRTWCAACLMALALAGTEDA